MKIDMDAARSLAPEQPAGFANVIAVPLSRVGRPLLGSTVWLHAGILAAIGMCCVLLVPAEYEQEGLVLWSSAGVAITSLVLLLLCARQVGGILSPQGLFLSSAICFNAGQAIVCTLGDTPTTGIYAELAAVITLRTLLFVALGLTAFSTGTCLSLRAVKNLPGNMQIAAGSTKTLQNIGLGMIALGFPFWIYRYATLLYRVGQYGRSIGYFGFESSKMDRVTEPLGDFLPVGIMWVLAGSRRPATRRIAALSIVVVIATHLAIGSRGPALATAAACAWLWHVTVRRIRPLPMIAAVVVCMFVVIPMIEATRESWGPNGFSPSYMIETYRTIKNPALRAMGEMGWSATTIGHTMTLIPSSRQWDFGASYLWAVTTVLPNFGMEAHPAKAHGYLSDWLVETLAPAYAARGGGFGYSFLAEAYANGGWLGGPPLLFAQGLAFGALWRLVYRKHDRAHYAFGACALMTVLILARGEMGTVVRALTWQGFAPYALYRLLTRRRNRLPSQAQQESSEALAPPM